MTPHQTVKLIRALLAVEAGMTAATFQAAKGQGLRVVSSKERRRMNEVASKMAAGVSPYAQTTTLQVGGRASLPDRVRAKDVIPEPQSRPLVREPKLHRRGKTASQVFDSTPERVENPLIPVGQFQCFYCKANVTEFDVQWGHPSFQVDKEGALIVKKNAYHEQTQTDPPYWEERIAHSTGKALPACRKCSPLFARIKFPTRHT